MILISARSTSKRFPCKHLAPLHGSTVLDVLISRLRQTELDFAFLIPSGDPYKAEMERREVPVFEGPEDDVLKRYALAMEYFKLEWCIRITGDCPLVSPQDIAYMANECPWRKIDYGYNFARAQVDGMEVEFISRRMMQWLDGPTKPEYREHVTLAARDMRKSLEINGCRFYDAPIQYGWHGAGKLSVDTPEDLERVERVMKEMES